MTYKTLMAGKTYVTDVGRHDVINAIFILKYFTYRFRKFVRLKKQVIIVFFLDKKNPVKVPCYFL